VSEPRGAAAPGLTSEERQRRARREGGASKAPRGERTENAVSEPEAGPARGGGPAGDAGPAGAERVVLEGGAIDGDGAFLMNLCGLPTIALQNPGNLIHLLFDNECYEASGGTATASRITDAVSLAKGAGYKHAAWAKSAEEFRAAFVQAWKQNELTLIAAKVDPGQPANLPALRLDEIENKYRFMRYLEETEKKSILGTGFDSKL